MLPNIADNLYFDFMTADIHAGHHNIIRYCKRPWNSLEEMEEGIVERWNVTVPAGARVGVLGDVIMDSRAPNRANAAATNLARLKMISRLNGELHLIPGNHDPCHPQLFQDAATWERHYLDAGFHTIHSPTMLITAPDGRPLKINHFPYDASDIPDARFHNVRHRAGDNPLWLIHGHVHDRWKQNGRQINVGLDAWDWYPVPMSTVLGMTHKEQFL